MKQRNWKVAVCAVTMIGAALAANAQINVIEGADNNSTLNPFVQPQDDALAGGGRDQTMQFGDVLFGEDGDDLVIGRLGTDIMATFDGNDVIMGGIEHFNPSNRDRAFGGPGGDIFIWKPGDGSDTFFGGPGDDAIVFGVTGEIVNGQVDFSVIDDQLAGEVFISPATDLPRVDLTNSPGFCEIIDGTFVGDAAELDALSLDHLIRFSLRSFRDDFENGVQDTDNGLRVTLHLAGVEFLVCTNRDGGIVEYFDLRTEPATLITVDDVTPGLRERLDSIVF